MYAENGRAYACIFDRMNVLTVISQLNTAHSMLKGIPGSEDDQMRVQGTSMDWRRVHAGGNPVNLG